MRNQAVGARPSLLAGLLLCGGAALLAGCSVNSPVQTQLPYQPSDGVQVNLGTITISDLLVVAKGADAPGRVSGLIRNTTATPQTLTITSPDGSTSKTEVPPGPPLDLAAPPGAVVLAKAGAPAGGLVQLKLSTPSSGTDSVGVPVLLPELYYATLTPTAPPTSGTTPSTPGPLSSTPETGGPVVSESSTGTDRP